MAPPVPGKCLRQSFRPTERATSTSAATQSSTICGSAEKLRCAEPMSGLSGLMSRSTTGARFDVDAELAQFEIGGPQRRRAVRARAQPAEWRALGSGREAALLLEAAHLAALLIDEDQRMRRQRMQLRAERLHLRRIEDIALIFVVDAVVVEQDDAAEAEVVREIAHPGRNMRRAKAEQEELADGQSHESTGTEDMRP